MSDYDFKTLNDKEFEILCADLLSVKEGKKFERFKTGRDKGVDGRYFSETGNEVLLQCKHWPDTSVNVLAKKFALDEKPKIEKLNPERYLVAVSTKLSRDDKKNIKKVLEPYVKRDDDIFGREDLNDILKDNKQIERKHYKLWLHSTQVLGSILNNAIYSRSQGTFEKIRAEAHRYVVTQNHIKALEQLERHGAVIITGEPGIGKSMLAEHLCLHCVANGFEYFKINGDIAETENIFNRSEKQIFYFDDFLGRNYLEALDGHEGTKIVDFFSNITANKENKRFILTSRSTILNQGKLLIDKIQHHNLRRNEYEIRIQSLSEIDKAHILYNHIWHSGLSQEYIEELYAEKRYRLIIRHRNFNPRLISFITDGTRLGHVKPSSYWEYVSQALENPADVWDNAFQAQQDDFGRAIVFLVVLNGRQISEAELSEAFSRFIKRPESHTMRGWRTFQENLRILVGSLLNRTVTPNGGAWLDLFNPSIGDYVIKHYSGEFNLIRSAILSLYTLSSLRTLQSMVLNELLTVMQKAKIERDALHALVDNDFEDITIQYLSHLCVNLFADESNANRKSVQADLLTSINHIFFKGKQSSNKDTFDVLRFAHLGQMISIQSVTEFLGNDFDDIVDDDEISSIVQLLKSFPEETEELEKISENLKSRVIEIASDHLEGFIDVTAAFDKASFQDHTSIEDHLAAFLEEKFDKLGISVTYDDISTLIDDFDLRTAYSIYCSNNEEHDHHPYDGPSGIAIDEIEDLFDRS